MRMMGLRQPHGPPCPMCKADMEISKPIQGQRVWYCPRCGFVDFEGGGWTYE